MDNTQNLVPYPLQAIHDQQALTNCKLSTLSNGIMTLRREVQVSTADVCTLGIASEHHTEPLVRLAGRLVTIDPTRWRPSRLALIASSTCPHAQE